MLLIDAKFSNIIRNYLIIINYLAFSPPCINYLTINYLIINYFNLL